MWEAISLSDLLEILGKEAQVLNSRVVVHSAIEPGLELAGDPRQVRDLFLAVIENSARYIPDAGRIDILAERDEAGNAIIEIRDNGIGLTEEEAMRATERFHRGNRARRMFPSGTGLGLAIASRIAGLHGGELQIQPRPGGGAIVRITLPLLS